MKAKISWNALALVSVAAFLVGWGLVGVGHGIGLAVFVAGFVVLNVKYGPTFW